MTPKFEDIALNAVAKIIVKKKMLDIEKIVSEAMLLYARSIIPEKCKNEELINVGKVYYEVILNDIRTQLLSRIEEDSK